MTTMTTGPNGLTWASVRDNEDVRRTWRYVLIALLLAVVTGPKGSGERPFSGIRGALLSPRVLPFLLVAGAASGAVWAMRQWNVSVDDVRRRVTARAEVVPYRQQLRLITPLLLLLVAVLYPLTLSEFWQRVLVDKIGVFVLLALGLNVVVGLAGLLDLGYIAFFAIGAYTTAYFTGKLPPEPPIVLNPFLIIPIAVVVAMIAGVLLGAPTLRLRGDYLAIVTLGFGEIIRLLAVNLDPITNGPRGAILIPHFSAFGYEWELDSLPYYYLLLAFTLVIIFAFRRLEHSRIGRAWTAVREDEVAAAATGVPTVKTKLLAFALGASTAGFIGVFYASKVGFISPENFLLLNSILVLVYVIFGGMGSLYGVILGAAVLAWLPEVLRDYVPAEDRFIYFGILLVVMMIFRPQGLIPSKRRARELAHVGGTAGDSLGGAGTGGVS